ncbi:MAG: hypothetical protein Q9211_005066, partial [Gyalolechia sp. 1 TL-2023]
MVLRPTALPCRQIPVISIAVVEDVEGLEGLEGLEDKVDVEVENVEDKVEVDVEDVEDVEVGTMIVVPQSSQQTSASDILLTPLAALQPIVAAPTTMVLNLERRQDHPRGQAHRPALDPTLQHDVRIVTHPLPPGDTDMIDRLLQHDVRIVTHPLLPGDTDMIDRLLQPPNGDTGLVASLLVLLLAPLLLAFLPTILASILALA